MIHGVIIKPLKKMPDERGCVMHMMRNDDPEFKQFGEVYFSQVYPEAIKAWHLHQKMILNYAVPVGMIKLVLYDPRDDSPTRGELMELYIGEQNYCLVKVPVGVWNGFKGLGTTMSLVVNCATEPHDAQEIMRMDPHENTIIKYNWERKDR